MRRVHRTLLAVLGWLATLGLAGTPAAHAAADPKPGALLVDVRVNGQPLADITAAHRLEDGRLALPVAAWREMRLAPPPEMLKLPDGSHGHALEALPGLTYNFNARKLALEITAPPQAFASQSIAAASDASPLPLRPHPGGMLNYDVVLSGPRSQTGAGGTFEAVVFGPLGSAVASVLVTSRKESVTGEAAQASLRTRVARLETAWQIDSPERMESLVVGDTISDGGGWSRPVRFGGLRFGRDFSLRPGFVTVPQAALAGSAALPSAVEVLVNGQQRMSQNVTPGAFELTNVPVVSGAGEVNLVVRDLLGRETIVRQSYYSSPRLLAPGLSDYQFEAGWLRTEYGQGMGEYGGFLAAGTWRRGLTPALTVEGRAELMRERQAAGIELSGLLGSWAAGRAVIAFSHAGDQGPAGEPRSGARAGLALERSAQDGGWSVAWDQFARGFTQLAAVPGETEPRQRLQAGLQRQLGHGIGLGLSYVRQSSWNAPDAAVLGATVSAPLPRSASLSMSFSRQVGHQPGWRAGVAVAMPLGDGAYGASTVDRLGDGRLAATVQANRAVPSGEGQGWYLRASDVEGGLWAGGVNVNTARAELSAEVEAGRDRAAAVRLGARGTLGTLGGMNFASRPTGRDAFAVVKAGDVAGIPVLRSHQVVAHTGEGGLALVPGLLPYEINLIEIDASELPLDVQVGQPQRRVVPYARSGVMVDFDLARSRDQLVQLVQADGSDVPLGAQVDVEGTARRFTAARRGEVYLTGLGAHHRLDVRWNGAPLCSARLGPAKVDGVARLGCTREQLMTRLEAAP